MMGNYWGYGPMNWGWLGMGFGLLLNIVFWILVIALIFFAVRSLSGRRYMTHHDEYQRPPSKDGMKTEKDGEDGALRILRERYAKGEINKGEYEERKKTLFP